MFPACSFAKWETVLILEEMEGEGVPKSDAAMSNEAQVEPLEKKGKFEVSSLKQLFPFSRHSTILAQPPPLNPQPPPPTLSTSSSSSGLMQLRFFCFPFFYVYGSFKTFVGRFHTAMIDNI